MDKERLFRFIDKKYASKREMYTALPLGMNADDIMELAKNGKTNEEKEIPALSRMDMTRRPPASRVFLSMTTKGRLQPITLRASGTLDTTPFPTA